MLLTAAPASAASRQAQERAARKACLNGDYAKGVSVLSDLFVDTKDATYIFNQGRCFEQNRRYEDAIGRFDEYLRAAQGELKAEDKASAEKHRADCKEKLAEERSNSPTQPAPLLAQPVTAPPLVPKPEPPAEPSTSTVVETAPQQAQQSTGGRGMLTAGIITGAVGVGGVVAGIIFNMKANSTINDMQDSIGAYSTAKDNSQKTYKTLAWVGYGVGAACVATGAVLIGVGIKSGTNASTNVALVPALGPGHMGAMLTGGF
jgi:tetratricopeptide (TPR) repeat protein